MYPLPEFAERVLNNLTTSDPSYQPISTSSSFPLSDIYEENDTDLEAQTAPPFTDKGDEATETLNLEPFKDEDNESKRAILFQDPRPRSKSVTWLFYALSIIRSLALILAPSFITNRWKEKPTTPVKVPPTAYLNGVRGVAAFCVWCQHYIAEYYNVGLFSGYGTQPADRWIIQLPFVRLVYSGGFMVPVFFVMSGFVLSYKPLKLARAKDQVALYKNLASSVFRRGPRLFLPLVPIFFVISFLVYYGWYSVPGRPFDQTHISSIHSSIFGELNEAFWSWEYLASPLSSYARYWPNHNAPLWTLPFEFRGSFIVFVLVLALSQAKTYVRMGTFAVIAWYFIWKGRWDYFLFVCGSLLAEIRLIRIDSKFALNDFIRDPKIVKITQHLLTSFWVIVLFCSLYLGSWAHEHGSIAPGYINIARLSPAAYIGSEEGMLYFWNSIAAVAFIASLEHCPIFQIPFNTAFVRYIGDVSFSMYSIHAAVLWTFGRSVTTGIVGLLGNYHWGVLCSFLILSPMLISISDVQWRLFDEGSVKLARWVETRFFS